MTEGQMPIIISLEDQKFVAASFIVEEARKRWPRHDIGASLALFPALTDNVEHPDDPHVNLGVNCLPLSLRVIYASAEEQLGLLPLPTVEVLTARMNKNEALAISADTMPMNPDEVPVEIRLSTISKSLLFRFSRVFDLAYIIWPGCGLKDLEFGVSAPELDRHWLEYLELKRLDLGLRVRNRKVAAAIVPTSA
jgi:hypothetical protein